MSICVIIFYLSAGQSVQFISLTLLQTHLTVGAFQKSLLKQWTQNLSPKTEMKKVSQLLNCQ